MRAILSLLFFAQMLWGHKRPPAFTLGSQLENYQILEKKGEIFHYRTEHYHIESDSALNDRLLKNITKIVESVAFALKQIPLPLSWPAGKELPVIKICATKESFQAEGGPKNSAGFYDSRRIRVLILRDQFLIPPATQSRMIKRPNFSILVHELVHLRMHGYLPRTEPWFHEGVAEYLAASYGSAGNSGRAGEFSFVNMEQRIRKRIERHSDPTQAQTQLTSLKKLVALDSSSWREHVITKGEYELLEPYSSSLILMHYFFHGGKERHEQIQRYLEKAQKIIHRDDPRPTLLTAEQAGQTEKRLIKYWSSHGLKLRFQ